MEDAWMGDRRVNGVDIGLGRGLEMRLIRAHELDWVETHLRLGLEVQLRKVCCLWLLLSQARASVYADGSAGRLPISIFRSKRFNVLEDAGEPRIRQC